MLQISHVVGHWRLLDFDFMGKVLEQIVAVKDEHGWEMDSIPVGRTCDILEDLYPRFVITNFSQNPDIMQCVN